MQHCKRKGLQLARICARRKLSYQMYTCCKATASRLKGPIAYSVLCSKHFEADCFITEGVRYHDTARLPAKKRLKPNAIHTIFPKPDVGISKPTTPLLQPLKRRKQKAMVDEALQSTSVKSWASTYICSTSQDAALSSLLDEVPMQINDSKQDKVRHGVNKATDT